MSLQIIRLIISQSYTLKKREYFGTKHFIFLEALYKKKGKHQNAINERLYGKHSIKAALLMRQALLIGGLLSNAETWINLTEMNISKLTLLDTALQRALLSSSGNPSRVSMCLELGVIPVCHNEESLIFSIKF